jgi:hypothetical protein
MTFTRPSAQEFEILKDLIVHLPTGARFTRGGNVNYGRAGSILPDGNDYLREDVRAMAARLLFASEPLID